MHNGMHRCFLRQTYKETPFEWITITCDHNYMRGERSKVHVPSIEADSLGNNDRENR